MPGRRKQPNIQDGYLFESLKEKRPLTFALLTGGQLQGRIRRFDRFCIVVESAGEEILLYKQSIAVIAGVGPTSGERAPRS